MQRRDETSILLGRRSRWLRIRWDHEYGHAYAYGIDGGVLSGDDDLVIGIPYLLIRFLTRVNSILNLLISLVGINYRTVALVLGS
jgi:hypothetical protein